MEINLTEIIIAGIGIVSVIVTHLLGRRRTKAEITKLKVETQGDSIGNIDKSLDFYEKWVEKTNKRLDEVLENQDKLIKENIVLKEELSTVKSQTTRLTTLLCTKLPCNERVQDSSVIDCIYLSESSAKKARKVVNKKVKATAKN